MARTCVFCGATPLTQEHVWPVWIRDLLGGIARDPFVLNRFGSSWQSPRIDIRVKRVCRQCNNGWLSDLEGKAQRILTPMIPGPEGRVILAPADQQVLARWAYKTALMANLLYPKSDVGLPVYAGYFKHRRPPDQTVIWTAAYGGRSAAIHLHRELIEITEVDLGHRNPGLFPNRTNGVAITFNVFRVIFQVLMYEGEYREESQLTEGPYFQRIWPVAARALSWPPSGRALSHDALQRFANRRGVL